jgi:hypothetical protein
MGGGLLRAGRYLSVEWISIDDRLYLVDGESQVTDYEVIRIGGVPVEDIRKQVDTYYFSENDSAKHRQYEVYCRQDDMLLLAGSQYTGGNSNVGEELLAAMEMTPPSYGCYVCHSDLSKKLRGGSASGKVICYKPDPSTAQRNKDVELVVLTDRLTFSSATMLGVWVRDGDLGVIVGQPSSNAPTYYGDMLSVHLPVSNINLNVSCKSS